MRTAISPRVGRDGYLVDDTRRPDSVRLSPVTTNQIRFESGSDISPDREIYFMDAVLGQSYED